MSNYIIADTRFCDEIAAAEQGLSIQEYCQMIVDNWNSIIKDEDYVYVYGTVGIGKRMDLREVISKLNGHLVMTQYNKNKLFEKEEWRRWGFQYVWDTDFNYDGGKIYFPHKTGYDNGEPHEVIVVTAESNLGTVFKDNQLSLEAKYWDFLPINVAVFPDIVDRIKEYDKMEEQI